MKLKKEENSWYLYFGDNTLIHSINDWKQIIGKYNWYEFHFIHIFAENDIMCPGWEFEFVILGLGFRLRVNRDWSGTEIQNRLDKMKKEPVKADKDYDGPDTSETLTAGYNQAIEDVKENERTGKIG